MRNGCRFFVAMLAGASVIAGACSEGTALRDAPPGALAFADPTTTIATGATVRVGLVGVDSLDPVKANPASPSSMTVADLLFDGLTGYDASRSAVVGRLAISWGVSADGLTWHFDLDPDAVFADGSPVTPADVKASIERVAALGDASLSGLRLAVVVGYDDLVKKTAAGLSGVTVAGSTVNVQLRAPYAALAELLADPVFGVVKASDVGPAGLAATPIGSGPFALESRTATTLRFVRAPKSDAVLGAVEATVYADAAAATAAFDRGELDIAPLAGDKVAAGATAPARLVSAPQHVSYVYGMNVAAPALANVQLRQAVLRAVDRDAIRQQYFPGASTLSGLIGPGVIGRRDNACGTACAFDVTAAKALVAAAYPAGGVPTVHVDYFDEATGREAKVAAAVVAGLVAAGIPAEVRGHSVEEFRQLVASGGAELFRYGWVGSYPSADAYLAPFESSGVDNVFSLADAELTASLTTARSTASEAARTSAYLAAEDRVLALAPVLPLVQFQTHLVVRDTVQNLQLGPDGAIDLEHLRVVE